MATFVDKQCTTEELECPNCLKKLNCPELLSCAHFFCETCIDEIFSRQNGGQLERAVCPLCKKITESKDLKDMPIVDKILKTCQPFVFCCHCEAAPATLRCVDCQSNYCDTCKSLHDKVPMFLSHLFGSVDDSAPQKIIDEVLS